MSGSWENAHRRYALAHALADDVQRAGPSAIRGREAEINEVYGGLDQALQDIQYRWYHAFHAAADVLLEDGGSTDPAAVWRSTAKTHGSYRAVLDAFADHPALAEGEEYHRIKLLAATGKDQRQLAATPAVGRCPRRKLLSRARSVARLVAVA